MTVYADCRHERSSQPTIVPRRSLVSRPPPAVYSKDELIAEMGGAYLCAEAGISNAVIENQAAYVTGWLKKWRACHVFSNQEDHIMRRKP